MHAQAAQAKDLHVSMAVTVITKLGVTIIAGGVASAWPSSESNNAQRTPEDALPVASSRSPASIELCIAKKTMLLRSTIGCITAFSRRCAGGCAHNGQGRPDKGSAGLMATTWSKFICCVVTCHLLISTPRQLS